MCKTFDTYTSVIFICIYLTLMNDCLNNELSNSLSVDHLILPQPFHHQHHNKLSIILA